LTFIGKISIRPAILSQPLINLLTALSIQKIFGIQSESVNARISPFEKEMPVFLAA